MYRIKMTCYDYNVYAAPYLEIYDKAFNTKEEADKEAQLFSLEEAQELNIGARNVNGNDARFFTGETDGSEEFDYVVRCWDGDDYTVVSGYTIIQTDI